MSILNYSELSTQIGDIFVVATDRGISNVIFNRESFEDFRRNVNGYRIDKGGKAKIPANEINLYIKGKLKKFTSKLDISCGTPFHIQVWERIMDIPYGKVITYKKLAEKLGKPNAARAVGNAVGANPVPIIIPCHRVTASNGLGGYSSGLRIKKMLLKIEGAIS